MPSSIIRGIYIGVVSGILTGVLMLISDGIFYSRFITDFEMARKYNRPAVQILVFAAVSVLYGAVQGGVFAWLLPVLPTGRLARGALFGLMSYLILSRHFVEGLAFMNPKHMPVRLSVYLSLEFLIAYVIQGVIISRLY